MNRLRAAWSGWPAAVRVAYRGARRAKGRSTLVVALIALPVAALSFAAVSYDSFRLTPEQRLDRELGAADALLRWHFAGPVTQDRAGYAVTGHAPARAQPATDDELRAVLPPGSRTLPLERARVRVDTPDGEAQLDARAVDLADPAVTGMATIREGRAPGADREVALTAPAADRLDAGVGDAVTLAESAGSVTVVGIVEFPSTLYEIVVFHPEHRPALPAPDEWDDRAWLLVTPQPVTWEQVRALNRHGLVVRSRAVLRDRISAGHDAATVERTGIVIFDRPSVPVAALLVGLVALEVVLLAGPAFAIGARRRQRELALVAAAGGTPAHQRRIVLAEGLVLGVTAAVLGVLLGALLAAAAQPLLATELWLARPGGYRFYPEALLAIAGLATATGVAAAALPAVTAARQPVVAALDGRRPTPRLRRRWLVTGVAAAAAGGALAVWGAWQVRTPVVLAGLALGELGLVLCTPALVGVVGRTGRWLPYGLRLALRDTARNRAAAAPAVAAVMAAAAGCLALATVLGSVDARQRGEYVPALPDGGTAVLYPRWWSGEQTDPVDSGRVREAVQAATPQVVWQEVTAAACPERDDDTICEIRVDRPAGNVCPLWRDDGELTTAQRRAAAADERCRGASQYSYLTFPEPVVDDGGSTLPALTGAAPDDLAAARRALAAGRVVVTDPLLLRGDGTVEVRVLRHAAPTEGRSPGTETLEQRSVRLPGYALTTATRRGAVFLTGRSLAAAGLEPQPVGLLSRSGEPLDGAQRDALRAVLRELDQRLELYVEQPPEPVRNPLLLLATGLAGAVVLGATGIATGLAAADRRPELTTLAAVGAGPGVRRLLALCHAGVIAGLGTLLGGVAGTAAGTAVLLALNQPGGAAWPPLDPFPLGVPWRELGLLLTVPVLAMALAGLFTRSGLPVDRRAS